MTLASSLCVLRHTYGTEMLRAGVSFAAVIKLLGHKSPHMTLEYLEITQQDLQREFELARSHPRHLAPHPRTPHTLTPPHADLATLIHSLQAAQHVLEMYRRSLADQSARRSLDRLANRLAKILAAAKNFD
jgi:Phage integrase family